LPSFTEPRSPRSAFRIQGFIRHFQCLNAPFAKCHMRHKAEFLNTARRGRLPRRPGGRVLNRLYRIKLHAVTTEYAESVPKSYIGTHSVVYGNHCICGSSYGIYRHALHAHTRGVRDAAPYEYMKVGAGEKRSFIMRRPKRKRMRLENYDYSKSGMYYLTICSKDNLCIFSRISGIHSPQTELSEYGLLIEKTLDWLDKNNEHFSIDCYIIMPNHLHVILVIENSEDGSQSPAGALVPKFVSSLKRHTNKMSKTVLWQRGYYDHIIRNHEDYLSRRQYIESNPAKWAEDKYYCRP
jgi:putative transposase